MEDKESFTKARRVGAFVYRPIFGTLEKGKKLIKLTTQEDIIFDFLSHEPNEIVPYSRLIYEIKAKNDLSRINKPESLYGTVRRLRDKIKEGFSMTVTRTDCVLYVSDSSIAKSIFEDE